MIKNDALQIKEIKSRTFDIAFKIKKLKNRNIRR